MRRRCCLSHSQRCCHYKNTNGVVQSVRLTTCTNTLQMERWSGAERTAYLIKHNTNGVVERCRAHRLPAQTQNKWIGGVLQSVPLTPGAGTCAILIMLCVVLCVMCYVSKRPVHIIYTYIYMHTMCTQILTPMLLARRSSRIHHGIAKSTQFA